MDAMYRRRYRSLISEILDNDDTEKEYQIERLLSVVEEAMEGQASEDNAMHLAYRPEVVAEIAVHLGDDHDWEFIAKWCGGEIDSAPNVTGEYDSWIKLPDGQIASENMWIVLGLDGKFSTRNEVGQPDAETLSILKGQQGSIIHNKEDLDSAEEGTRIWSASLGSSEPGSGDPLEKLKDELWFDRTNNRHVESEHVRMPALLVGYLNGESAHFAALREKHGEHIKMGAIIIVADGDEMYSACIIGATEQELQVRFDIGSPMLNDLIHLDPTSKEITYL